MITESIPDSVKFLALGDSYTIGESVPVNERWPVQLSDSLKTSRIITDTLIIIAKTGWTTDELKKGIAAANPEGTFNLVSLLIGVNNQFRGRDTGEYRIQFRELLEIAINFAGGSDSRVIVLSIPDWGATPFGVNRNPDKIAEQIDNFNRINQEETLKTKASYFNITAISRLARTDPSLIAPDNLHPSGKMYKLWVEHIFPDVIKLVRTNP